MTKYVLQSGGIRNNPEMKMRFHQELVRGLGNRPKFVLCNFAQGREYWDIKFQGYSDALIEGMPEGVIASFELAMPDIFEQQCQAADILYFHGGDDHLLQYWMKKYDLSMLFDGKVVATNSASSDMLATHHYTNDWRARANGFGILPIKFFPHFQADTNPEVPRGPLDNQAALEQLAAYGDTSLPIYAMKEGEYIVVEPGQPIQEFRRDE